MMELHSLSIKAIKYDLPAPIQRLLQFESNHAGSNSPAILRVVTNPIKPLPALDLIEYRDIYISVKL